MNRHHLETSASTHKAFTLLELLALLCVILILAVLLLPVVTKMRDAAATTKCASNLRDIGAATFAYIGDNNGFLPVSYNLATSDFTDFPVCAWYVCLAPYLDVPVLQKPRDLGGPPYKRAIPRPTVFACPSHKMAVPIPDNVRPVSYAPVMYSAANAPVIDGISRGRLTSVVNPSKKIWIQDSSTSNIYNSNSQNFSIPNGPAYQPFLRHGNAVNALFFDGHVERVPFERISPTAPNTDFPDIYYPFQ